MKKILSALILAILVMGSITILSSPHVKAQTTQVTILSYSWYTSPTTTQIAQYAGDLIVVGEVENTGTTSLSTVTVSGAAYNSTNDLVGSGQAALIGVPVLLPGQKAPFYMDFLPQNSPTVSQDWVPTVTNVVLMTGAEVPTNQTIYSGLTTSNLHNFINSGKYTVTGTVANSGDQTIGQVWVLVTFYNSTGTVVSMNCTAYLDSSNSGYSLSPGNAVTFTSSTIDDVATVTSQIANYSVLIESSPYSAPSSTPTPSPSPNSSSPTATPTDSSAHATSSPINALLTDAAVAAVVIVVVAIVALMLLRNRRGKGQFEPLPPPPPPPPPE